MILLCAIHYPTGHPRCGRHPVTIPKLPSPFFCPQSDYYNPEVTVPWTTQCPCQWGAGQEGRQKSPATSSLLGNILLFFETRETGSHSISPAHLSQPIPASLWHVAPKDPERLSGCSKAAQRNHSDPFFLVLSSSAFPCDTISCDSELLLYNPNSVPATILLDFEFVLGVSSA